MRIRANNVLLGIIAVTLMLILIIAVFPDNILRIILGLPLILFFPGYTLLAALFPVKENFPGIERFALSFGISIAVVPLIGLILNYTPWGIRLYPVLISLALFIGLMSAAAWYRGRRFPPDERIGFTVNFKLPSLRQSWNNQSRGGKIFSVALVAAIVGATGLLVYVANIPRVPEKFTEFYVLNSEGKAEDYPSLILLGRSDDVILGIINHEHEATNYRVEITIDGEIVDEIKDIEIEHEETWEQMVALTPVDAGENLKVEFMLYKDSSEEVYENLHLWIDVK